MSEHTNEPWGIVLSREQNYHVVSGLKHKNYYGVCTMAGKHKKAEANARRIVACVNACAGVSTEDLEKGTIDDLLSRVCDMIGKVIKITPKDGDCDGQNCAACANPCEKHIEELR